METAIWYFRKFDLSSVLHDEMLCVIHLVDAFCNCGLIGVLHVLYGIDLDFWLILTRFYTRTLHVHTNKRCNFQFNILKNYWSLATIRTQNDPIWLWCGEIVVMLMDIVFSLPRATFSIPPTKMNRTWQEEKKKKLINFILHPLSLVARWFTNGGPFDYDWWTSSVIAEDPQTEDLMGFTESWGTKGLKHPWGLRGSSGYKRSLWS